MLKRVLSILICLLLLVSAAGCGKKKAKNPDDTKSDSGNQANAGDITGSFPGLPRAEGIEYTANVVEFTSEQLGDFTVGTENMTVTGDSRSLIAEGVVVVFPQIGGGQIDMLKILSVSEANGVVTAEYVPAELEDVVAAITVPMSGTDGVDTYYPDYSLMSVSNGSIENLPDNFKLDTSGFDFVSTYGKANKKKIAFASDSGLSGWLSISDLHWEQSAPLVFNVAEQRVEGFDGRLVYDISYDVIQQDGILEVVPVAHIPIILGNGFWIDVEITCVANSSVGFQFSAACGNKLGAVYDNSAFEPVRDITVAGDNPELTGEFWFTSSEVYTLYFYDFPLFDMSSTNRYTMSIFTGLGTDYEYGDLITHQLIKNWYGDDAEDEQYDVCSELMTYFTWDSFLGAQSWIGDTLGMFRSDNLWTQYDTPYKKQTHVHGFEKP